jgi:hypothetical protein
MQVTSNGRVRRSEAEWQEIISRWQKSGLKPRPFCRREQIQLSSFLRWQGKGHSTFAAPSANEFVQVVAPSASSPASSSWTLEISLPNGCQLRFQG